MVHDGLRNLAFLSLPTAAGKRKEAETGTALIRKKKKLDFFLFFVRARLGPQNN